MFLPTPKQSSELPAQLTALPLSTGLVQTGFPDTKSRPVQYLIFAIVMLLSALYTAKELKRGWFPWDDGILAQSAENVLRGELPHRDYVEIYTGGLSYLNAAAFRLFGTNLASMRYMLFLFFLLWVAAFFYAARQFVSASPAGALTLLAVAWSIPNYSAAMPSWYNLFFATFGLAALLRYVEIESNHWLFVAGLCGGISVLFKVSGLYFIAGALLFLLFRAVVVFGTRTASRREDVSFGSFLTVSILVYEALVFLVLRSIANVATFLYFWVPNLAVGGAIIWLELYRAQLKSQRFYRLFCELSLFTFGVVIPIAIFLSPYVLSGSLLQFFGGTSSSVGEHLQSVNSKPSVLKFVAGIAANLILIAGTFLTRRRFAKLVGIIFFLAIPVVLFLVRIHPYADRIVWGTIASFLPLIVVLGAVLLTYWSMRNRLTGIEQQKLFLVLSVCATTSLIQFPFTTASYYCYVAPFAFLSAAALISQLTDPPKWALTGALCFCILYIALDVTPGFVMNMGYQYRPDNQTAILQGPRAGGLRVEPRYAQSYADLNVIIKQHNRGEYIYAIPNSPEIYFLNGLLDPTAALFRTSFDPSRTTQMILGMLREHNVKVIVFNSYVPFMQTVPENLRIALEGEFPNREFAGPFEVRWKQ